jgi:L-asparaginase
MEVAFFIAAQGELRATSIEAKVQYSGGIPMVMREPLPASSLDIEPFMKSLRQARLIDARTSLRSAIKKCHTSRVIIARGADTQPPGSDALSGIKWKTIVQITLLHPDQVADGSQSRDLGVAVGAVQVLSPGVYQVLEGRVVPARWVNGTLPVRGPRALP